MRHCLYSQEIHRFIEADRKANKQFRYVIKTQIEVSVRACESAGKCPKSAFWGEERP